jgi:GNAT superfamily N-acetyltransferase
MINMTENKNIDTKQLEFRLIESWPANDIVELYKAGGWWHDDYDPTGIPALIKGSFAFMLAIDLSSSHAIGMGRAVSDGVSDAYIQDVVVLDDWRGKGVGKKIVQKLLEYCIDKKLLWIGLVAEPGTKEFYLPLGFKILPGEPLVYQPEE